MRRYGPTQNALQALDLALAQGVQWIGTMQPTLVQVVGYDGSPLSELALRRALEEATRAEYSLVHVVAVAQPVGGKVRMPDGLVVDPWAGLMALRLTVMEFLRKWQCSDQAVRVVAHVASGEPGPTLIEAAGRLEAHSISVGVRGNSRVADDGRIGSVAAHVAQHATCKVNLQSLFTAREGQKPGDALRLYLVLGDGFTTPGRPPTRMARA